MPSRTGLSNYPAATDTLTTLAQGGVVIKTVLLQDLLAGVTDSAFVADASGALRQWVMVIDSETIYYETRYGIGRLDDLARGQAGTIATDHFAGATVLLYGPPRIDNPAIKNALIAIQSTLGSLGPVAANTDVSSSVMSLQLSVALLQSSFNALLRDYVSRLGSIPPGLETYYFRIASTGE